MSPVALSLGADQRFDTVGPAAVHGVADEDVGRQGDAESVEIPSERRLGDAIRKGRHLTRLHSLDQPPSFLLEERSGPLVIRDRQGVLHRLSKGTVRRVPVAGARMTRLEEPRILEGQLAAQQVPEEVVVAVPLPPTIQRDHEQVLPFEVLEERLAVRDLAHGGGQGGVHPVEDRRSKEEAAGLRRLDFEHLLDEIVGDEALATVEGLDERRRVRDVPQRESGELQAGHPAFGSLVQRSHQRLLQVQGEPLSHEGERLLVVEAQVLGAHVGDPSPDAEAGEGQRRLRARRHHDREPGRLMLEQAGQQAVHRQLVDLVKVVEHQHQGSVQVADRVREADDVSRVGADLPSQHLVEMLPAEIRERLLDGRDEVRDEAAGIGIQPVDLVPGHRFAPQRRQLGHQGRLAETRRRAHQGERRQARAQAREQPRAGDEAPRGPRHPELGQDDELASICGHRGSMPPLLRRGFATIDTPRLRRTGVARGIPVEAERYREFSRDRAHRGASRIGARPVARWVAVDAGRGELANSSPRSTDRAHSR